MGILLAMAHNLADIKADRIRLGTNGHIYGIRSNHGRGQGNAALAVFPE
jgi:hypothetical protein